MSYNKITAILASIVMTLGAVAQQYPVGTVFTPFGTVPNATLEYPLSQQGHDWHNVEVPTLSSIPGFPSAWHGPGPINGQQINMGLNQCVFYKVRLTQGEYMFRLKLGWLTGNWNPLGAHIAILPESANLQLGIPGATFIQGNVGVENWVQVNYVDIPETGIYWLVVDGFGTSQIRYNIYAELQ